MDVGPPPTGTVAETEPDPVPLDRHVTSGPGSAVPTAVDDRWCDRPDPSPVRTLVLNVTMEPLSVVAARRALVLVLAGKADVLHTNGHRFRSERLDLAAPSVVRLRRFVRLPYRGRAALSRRGVFVRDDHRCQYCGQAAENVDHVLPRSRGGPHAWENVVASCRRCNSRKKDRTPAEAGMELRRRPGAPAPAFWMVVALGGVVQPDWVVYLPDPLAG